MRDGEVEVSARSKAPDKYHLFEDFERGTRKSTHWNAPFPQDYDEPFGPFRPYDDGGFAERNADNVTHGQPNQDRASVFTMVGTGSGGSLFGSLACRFLGENASATFEAPVIPKIESLRAPWYMSVRAAFSTAASGSTSIVFGWIRSVQTSPIMIGLDEGGPPNFNVITGQIDRCVMGIPIANYDRPAGLAHAYYDTSVGFRRDTNLRAATLGQTTEIFRDTFYTMTMVSDGHGVNFLVNGERVYRQTDMSFLNDKGGNTFVLGVRGVDGNATKTLHHIDYVEVETERSNVILPPNVQPQ